MTQTHEAYMPLDRQLFQRSIAEALALLLAQRYPTAKTIARGIGIETSTAENLRKGHLSVPTLEKAVKVGGRDLWNKLGDEIFGETDPQFQAKRIASILSEAHNAITNLVQLSSYVEDHPAGSASLDAAPGRGEAGPARRQDGQARRSQAEGSGDRDSAPVEPKSFDPKRGRR